MSRFAERFSPALARLANEFGETGCTYTGPDGVILSDLTLRIYRQQPTQQIDANGRLTWAAQTAEVVAQVSVVSNPVQDGRFTIAGEVWSIDGRPVAINGKWKCNCVRSSAERLNEKRSKNV